MNHPFWAGIQLRVNYREKKPRYLLVSSNHLATLELTRGFSQGMVWEHGQRHRERRFVDDSWGESQGINGEFLIHPGGME